MNVRFCHRLRWALAAVVAVVLAVPLASASAQPSQSVNQLLISAARTQSAAYLQYFAYATGADRSSLFDVANVWRSVGQVEYYDHWTSEVTTANLYSGSDNVANLKTAIVQAQQVAHNDLSRAAENPGSKAARVLRLIAARETFDASLLSNALAAVQGHGSIPSPPPVRPVRLQVSPKPKYSGGFFNDLTSGSNSALEDSAWLWGEYQFMANTAVNTGQAKLAALFSGLEAQEQYQNWVEIANVAGYVNSVAMNLQASIASEAGAIQMYMMDAQAARAAGNPTVANLFTNIQGDEVGHHQTFTTELQEVTGTS
jgi:rubrerythrin